MVTSITTVTHLLFIPNHPGNHGHLILMELLDVGGVPIDGVAVTTKPVINRGQRLLDDVIPLPQVFDEFVVLIQQLTHQSPVLPGLSFETISLNHTLVNEA